MVKILEKLGIFVSPEMWEPCTFILGVVDIAHLDNVHSYCVL